jgi:hypothetical protein
MKPVFFIFLLLILSNGLHAEPLTKDQHQQVQDLFTALGCRACHDFDKSGSNLANSLDRIGLKLSEAEILQRLQRPPKKLDVGENFMPSYQTTSIEQLKLLSRFLANRK